MGADERAERAEYEHREAGGFRGPGGDGHLLPAERRGDIAPGLVEGCVIDGDRRRSRYSEIGGGDRIRRDRELVAVGDQIAREDGRAPSGERDGTVERGDPIPLRRDLHGSYPWIQRVG